MNIGSSVKVLKIFWFDWPPFGLAWWLYVNYSKARELAFDIILNSNWQLPTSLLGLRKEGVKVCSITGTVDVGTIG